MKRKKKKKKRKKKKTQKNEKNNKIFKNIKISPLLPYYSRFFAKAEKCCGNRSDHSNVMVEGMKDNREKKQKEKKKEEC